MPESAATSVAPETTTDLTGSDALERLSAPEREAWQKTGEWPTRAAKTDPAATDAAEADDDEEPAAVAPAKADEVTPAPVVEKPVSKRQQQINDLMRRETESRLKAEALEAKLAAVEAKIATPAKADEKAEKTTEPAPTRPKPLPAQFPNWDDYLEAVADWKLEQRDAKIAAERTKAETEARTKDSETAFRTRASEWITRRNAFAETEPAFTEKAMPWLAKVGPGTPIGDVLMDSPVGPQLALHLATHPEDVTRIVALHPIRQLVELGKLEQKFDSPDPATARAQEPVKTVTSAPAPPRAIAATKADVADDVDAAVSAGDFRAFAAAANRRALGK